jgi:hypothetical protein
MSRRTGSRRRSSIVLRIGLIVAAIGIVMLVIGIISYSAFRSSRSAPLEVAIYPDAELIASAPMGEGHDRLRYVSSSPAEEVAAFYAREMEHCVWLDNTVVAPSLPAFSQRCSTDQSSIFITQYTIVTVQPGVGENLGQTLIDIERVWGQQ